jgi:hypothetical protein
MYIRDLVLLLYCTVLYTSSSVQYTIQYQVQVLYQYLRPGTWLSWYGSPSILKPRVAKIGDRNTVSPDRIVKLKPEQEQNFKS